MPRTAKPFAPGRREALLAATALLAGIGPARAAEAFPARPVRIVVCHGPGGTADVMARIVGQKLGEAWKQPVIVENQDGAGGNLGTAAVYKSAADGHTLLLSATGPLAINEYLYRSIPFDPDRLEVISVLASTPNAVTVRSDLPVHSLKELIAYAGERPGQLSYGSAGFGSTQHLSGQLLCSMAGIDMLHVPFKAESAAIGELMAGRLDVFVGNVSIVLRQRASGKLRMLAVADERRHWNAPEVPTAAEAGLPGFRTSAWFAMTAPPGTDKAVVGEVARGVGAALALPDVRSRFAELGAQVLALSPAASREFIAAERKRWKRVIDDGRIRLD